MSHYFTDTRPEAEAILIQSARTLMMAGLRERYPQAGDPELRRRLADLVLGPTLAKEVYGPLEKALR